MEADPAAAFEAARAAIARGGPLRMVEVARLPGAIDVISCATHAPLGDEEPRAAAPGGAGVGLTWEDALVSTVGEAFERLALHPDRAAREALRTAAYTELGDAAVDPRRFNHFDDALYGTEWGPPAPFGADVEMPWQRAVALRRNPTEVWLPAECVFFSSASVPAHHGFCTTSGVACHREPAAALAGALYELLERDAFVGAWLRGLALPSVDPAAFGDATLETLRGRCAAAGVRLGLRDITGAFGVPTYLAIAAAEEGGAPAVGVGAACRLDGVAGARKAAIEAVHTWNWAHLKIDARGLLPSEAALRAYPLVDFGDHVYLYAHPAMKRRLGFLLDERRSAAPRLDAPLPSAAEECRVLADRLEAAGIAVYVVDQTPGDAGARGYIVLRALAPELLPLHAGPRLHRLCGSRVPPSPNPDPHPFP